MYTEETVSFSKTDDGGYVIHVRVKAKKSKDSKGEICCGPRHDDKALVARDDKELQKIIGKLLPDLKPGGMEEDEFNEAFKDAVKKDKEDNS